MTRPRRYPVTLGNRRPIERRRPPRAASWGRARPARATHRAPARSRARHPHAAPFVTRSAGRRDAHRGADARARRDAARLTWKTYGRAAGRAGRIGSRSEEHTPELQPPYVNSYAV